MNAIELKTVLVKMFKAQLPDMTTGASGLGKTWIKSQAAEAADMQEILFHPATMDSADFGGYPMNMVMSQGGVPTLIRSFDDLTAQLFEVKVPTVAHFDEFGQCEQPTQKALAPFFSPDRRVNKYKLPDCLAVSASTNTAAHRAGSQPILNHVRSRVTTLNLEPNLDAFLTRATIDHIHPYVMGFLKNNPAMLYELELMPKKMRDERGLTYDKIFTTGEGYTCPRSWYRIHELMQAGIPEDLHGEVYGGTIGDVGAQLFVAHCYHSKQNLDMDAVINDGAKVVFPSAKEPGLRWTFCYGAAALATNKTLGRVFEVANILHSESHSEYGMLIGQQCMATPKFLTHPEFQVFIKSPLGRLVQGTNL